MSNIFYTYRGQCPFLNKTHSINIKAAEVYIPRNPNPEYKNLSFSCSESNCCTYKNECPVFQNAYPR